MYVCNECNNNFEIPYIHIGCSGVYYGIRCPHCGSVYVGDDVMNEYDTIEPEENLPKIDGTNIILKFLVGLVIFAIVFGFILYSVGA